MSPVQIRLTKDVEKMLGKALPIAKKRGQFYGHFGSATQLSNFILWIALNKIVKGKR